MLGRIVVLLYIKYQTPQGDLMFYKVLKNIAFNIGNILNQEPFRNISGHSNHNTCSTSKSQDRVTKISVIVLSSFQVTLSLPDEQW